MADKYPEGEIPDRFQITSTDVFIRKLEQFETVERARYSREGGSKEEIEREIRVIVWYYRYLLELIFSNIDDLDSFAKTVSGIDQNWVVEYVMRDLRAYWNHKITRPWFRERYEKDFAQDVILNFQKSVRNNVLTEKVINDGCGLFHRIKINTLNRFLRKLYTGRVAIESDDPRLTVGSHGSTIEKNEEETLGKLCYHYCINRILSKVDRDILVVYYPNESLPDSELDGRRRNLAEKIGKTANNLYVIVFRIRKKLNPCLEKCGDAGGKGYEII